MYATWQHISVIKRNSDEHRERLVSTTLIHSFHLIHVQVWRVYL